MDNIAEGMTLDDTRVRISPLVPSIIYDYYMRNFRKEEVQATQTVDNVEYKHTQNEYTVGVLLGTQIESNIVVTNAFGVKYDFSKNKTLDRDYLTFMSKYLTKGTKETMLGMFHVQHQGQDINDLGVMAWYAMVRDEVKTNRPLLLTLDCALTKDSLNIKTYLPLDFDFGSTAENMCIFVDTPNEVITDNMAATGLDTVLYGQENYDTLSVFWRDAADSTSLTMDKIDELKKTQRLFDSGEKLKMNIESISALLKNAQEYVDAVEAGKIQGNANVDKALNAALSNVAHLTPDSIEKLLKDHYQDLLYISKLTHLIKDQLLISEQLASEVK